jgi:hypothetical protein
MDGSNGGKLYANRFVLTSNYDRRRELRDYDIVVPEAALLG